MESLGMEIDRHLFITCRLCLEENGVYQIVPSVQEQIKYCFGILVEHFDGLPQLLCKKCKLILNDYSEHKKNFIEKQKTLKRKLEEKQRKEKDSIPYRPNVNKTSDSEENDSNNSSFKHQKKMKRNRKKRNRLLSSSSDSSKSGITIKKKRKGNSNSQKGKKLQTAWLKHYAKFYCCRICSEKYLNTNNIYRHIKDHHEITNKHRHIIDNISKCVVSLDKLDNKPNLTGLHNTVVLRKDKIVQDNGKQYYYILYLLKNDQNNFDTKNSTSNNSESSDEVLSAKASKKTMRIDSGSTTDTIFIDDNISNKLELNKEKSEVKANDPILNVPKDTICIESSDSDLEANDKSEKNNENTNSANRNDLKGSVCMDKEIDETIIKEIISVCRKKYEKKLKLKSTSHNHINETQYSQLKNNILSIGAKTLNRRNFSSFYSLRLLRFLEHKNLNISWEKKSEMVSKEASFVRMAIKNSLTNANNDESGWVDVELCEPPNRLSYSNTASSTTAFKSKDISQAPIILQQTQILKQQQQQQAQAGHSVVEQNHFLQQIQIVPTLQIMQHSEVIPPQAIEQAVLYAAIVDESNTKKLLNTTPVANPKQLPKKNNSNDRGTNNNRSNVSNESVVVSLGDQIDESDMVMPVITSTTSLAEKKNSDDTIIISEDVNNQNNVDKPAPRIKVKPVSELMKPTSMMNIAVSPATNIWGYVQTDPTMSEKGLNIFIPNKLVPQIQTQSVPVPPVLPVSNMIPVERVTSEPVPKNTNSIILDTVDFPNTKTDSPFKYFKNLLLLRNIILTEANAPLTRDFVCLLKFKVQFKQENKNLTLCLSLFCSDNQFCISVRDGNQVNIHMAKMSANWQWEVMKVFQGYVTNKILQNAQKAGQDTYNRTKTFLCLLKSINQKQNQVI